MVAICNFQCETWKCGQTKIEWIYLSSILDRTLNNMYTFQWGFELIIYMHYTHLYTNTYTHNHVISIMNSAKFESFVQSNNEKYKSKQRFVIRNTLCVFIYGGGHQIVCEWKLKSIEIFHHTLSHTYAHRTHTHRASNLLIQKCE